MDNSQQLTHARPRVGRFAKCLAITVAGAIGGFTAAPVVADGVAVFESLSNASGIESSRNRLNSLLNVNVETTSIVIGGTDWTRLHSASMSESQARDLVAVARQSGYTAWYNGSADSLASSSSNTAVQYVDQVGAQDAPLAQTYPITSETYSTTTESYSSSDDWGTTHSEDDLSHLPMAETFPLDSF